MHQLPAIHIPAIGTPCHGGLFAGISTNPAGEPYPLILLPNRPSVADGADEAGRIAWAPAMAWAQALGGDLPSRAEGALLFQLLKAQFDEEWHWLNETTAWSKSSAWRQCFYDGSQYGHGKSYAGRARAVRRLTFQSFNALGEALAAG